MIEFVNDVGWFIVIVGVTSLVIVGSVITFAFWIQRGGR
jgi:hypothetical protein